jgi:hypothetical protein
MSACCQNFKTKQLSLTQIFPTFLTKFLISLRKLGKGVKNSGGAKKGKKEKGIESKRK